MNTSNSTRVKLEIDSVKVESDRFEKISSYEEQWQSDDEGDKEALSELLSGESVRFFLPGTYSGFFSDFFCQN